MIETPADMPELWLPLTVAFTFSVGLVYAVRPLAHLVGAVATPKADRWHRSTIPLLGGLAIAGAFLIAALLHPPASWQGVALVSGATALTLVGLVDDLPGRPPDVQARDDANDFQRTEGSSMRPQF